MTLVHRLWATGRRKHIQPGKALKGHWRLTKIWGKKRRLDSSKPISGICFQDWTTVWAWGHCVDLRIQFWRLEPRLS